MGRAKSRRSKSKKDNTFKKAGRAAAEYLTGKGKGTGKRRRGPSYWANKVLVEKLKRRYNKLKYGGVR